MISIYTPSEVTVTLSPETQQTIDRGCTNSGYFGDSVTVRKNPFDGGRDIQFDVYADEDNGDYSENDLLFSIDIEANQMF